MALTPRSAGAAARSAASAENGALRPEELIPEKSGNRRLERVLADLGGSIRRGEAPADPPPPLPSGLPEIDRLLGGGLPRGRISEVFGPASSGRTSLALAWLTHATRRGEVVSVVDAADSFDPASAESAGAVLSRVLWVRSPGVRESLRACERILLAQGFALVWLDLGVAEPVVPSAWPRLARAAAGSRAALLVLASQRCTGSQSDLALELEPARTRFTGTPALLEGMQSRARLVRNRRGPEGTATVQLYVS